MKIVGISCSPREESTTTLALQAALAAAKRREPDTDTQLIELAGLDVGGCTGCGRCTRGLECSRDDDFTRSVVPALVTPDLAGVIVGSPVYLGSMVSQCKAFLDRTVMLRRNGFLLRNRVGAALAVGGVRSGGQELTLQAIHAAMLCHDMVVVSDGEPTAHFGGSLWSGCAGGIAGDEIGLETARNLGGRVAQVAACLSEAARG